MGLHWKTVTRPNGKLGQLGQHEQITGLQAYSAWIAIIVSILGAVIYDRILIEHRLDTNAAESIQAKAELVNTIKVAIAETDRQTDYISRREWKDRQDELNKINADVLARLRRMEENQWYTNSILGKLPARPEPDQPK